MQARLIFLHALSPLHAGTGQGVGVIDLPIAREKATNIPYLPGSSLKGVLRDACSDSNLQSRVFGPSSGAEEYAGSMQVTDLRLLFLPVHVCLGYIAASFGTLSARCCACAERKCTCSSAKAYIR